MLCLCVCVTFTICCVYPFFHLAKEKLWISHVSRVSLSLWQCWLLVGGVYAMLPLCRCLFCLSKQHMQHRANEKGTSRRSVVSSYINFNYLRGVFENFLRTPLQYKLLTELSCLETLPASCLTKRTTPKRIMRPAIGFCWRCLLSAPNWQRQTHCADCVGERREKWVIKCK